eukprot:scaffold319_cov362-Pavlova_lutheri.AAC.13
MGDLRRIFSSSPWMPDRPWVPRGKDLPPRCPRGCPRRRSPDLPPVCRLIRSKTPCFGPSEKPPDPPTAAMALRVGAASLGRKHAKTSCCRNRSPRRAVLHVHASAAPRRGVPPRVVVVGTGMAGLVAALEARRQLEVPDAPEGMQVVVIDKRNKLGGNSGKSSNAINGINVEGGDSPQRFLEDILKSGKGKCDEALVGTLVEHVPDAIKFLQGCGVHLDKPMITGGHSVARTYRGIDGEPIGALIVKAMLKELQRFSKVRIILETGVKELVWEVEDGSEYVVGVKCSGINDVPRYVAGGVPLMDVRAGAVILASGGFAGSRKNLETYAPGLGEMPSTNNASSSGDGLSLVKDAGASVIDADQVQVHPTGFIDVQDPDAPVKHLAPEVFRGAGGILLNMNLERFANELTTRDELSAAILQQPKKRAYLLVPRHSVIAHRLGATMEKYVESGLVVPAMTHRELAELLGTSVDKVNEIFNNYQLSARKGIDEFGKTVFPAAFDCEDEEIYFMEVAPVVHCTMGGVAVDACGRVLDKSGKPINGIFAVGEVTGGLHGCNRLAGNALLESLVFGRIAGASAAQYILENSKREMSQV